MLLSSPGREGVTQGALAAASQHPARPHRAACGSIREGPSSPTCPTTPLQVLGALGQPQPLIPGFGLKPGRDVGLRWGLAVGSWSPALLWPRGPGAGGPGLTWGPGGKQGQAGLAVPSGCYTEVGLAPGAGLPVSMVCFEIYSYERLLVLGVF